MATRQFAYNPVQSHISGAILFRTLAVGSGLLDYSSNPVVEFETGAECFFRMNENGNVTIYIIEKE